MPRKGEIKNPRAEARKRFNWQRSGARKRNIEWKLTFDEWDNWFLSNGVDRNIAQKNNKDAWCMCRKGDTGAYELGNIYLATLGKNSLDLHTNGKAKYGNKGTGMKIKTPDGIFADINEASKYYGKTPQAIRWRINNNKEYEYAS